MKKLQFRKVLLKILVNFYEIMESASSKNYFVTLICIIFFFFQTFSFLAGSFLNSSMKKSDYMNIFLKIFYFSNFSNIITYLDSNVIASLFHIFFLISNLVSIIWTFQRIFIKLNTKIDPIIGKILLLHNWIFLIPILSFHMNEIFCTKNKRCKKNNESNIKLLNFIISIIEIPLTLGLSFFLGYFHREFKFLDNMLSPRHDSINVCIWLFRVLQPFIFMFFSDSIDIFLFTNDGIFLMSLFRSLRNPSSDKKFLINFDLVTKIYFSLLWILIICLYLAILSEPDFMYINALFLIFAFKLGWKKNDSLLLNNFLGLNINEQPIEICEMLAQFHFSVKKKELYMILFYHYFNKHYKNCTHLECLTEKKNLKAYFKKDFQSQTRSLSKFITIHIKSFYQKDKKMKNNNFEYVFFKWITCIIHLGINPLKSFYELILNEVNLEKKSVYFSAMIHYLKKKLNRQISFFLIPKISNEESKNYSEYYESAKIKIEMQKEMIDLINEKIKFFKNLDFRKNITPLEQISQNMLKLAPKLNAYKFKLSILSKTNNTTLKIIYLKFSSIFSSGILNSLNTSTDFEVKYDDLMKSSGFDKTYFTSNEINFLDDKMVTCDASFSKTSGLLIQSSLNEKFKAFFGYDDKFDNVLKSINDLIPVFMRETHSFFIQNYINSDQETFHNKGGRVFSFGITNQQLVFPVRISFSFNISIYHDFIMHGAIKSLEAENFMCFLCQKNGDILNVSKSMFNFFKEKFDIQQPENLSLLNLFFFLPSLKEIFKKPSTHLSNSGEFIIPLKIKTLVERLNNNNKLDFTRRISGRSSLYQGKKNLKEIMTDLEQIKLTIQKYFFENKVSLVKFKVFFDINYYFHKFGNENSNNLEYFMIDIKKITKINENEKVFSLQTNDFSTGSTFNMKLIVPDSNLTAHVNIFNRVKEATVGTSNLKETENKFYHDEKSERNDNVKILEKEAEKIKNNSLVKEIDCAFPDIKKTSIIKIENKFDYNEDNRDSIFSNGNGFSCRPELKNDAPQNRGYKESSSTSSTSQKNFSLIQRYLTSLENINPIPLKRINYLMVLHIILNIIYFFAFYGIISKYITYYQRPNEQGLIDQGKRISNIGLATLANVEMEYYYYNMTSNDDKSTYLFFLRKIVEFNQKVIREKNYLERNSENSLDYQVYYKKILTLEVDYQSFKINKKRFIDVLDESIDKLTYNLGIMKEDFDYNEFYYDYFISLQRNYIHYLNTSADVYPYIKNSYLSSNTQTSDQIALLFIFLLCFYFFTKVIELYFWNSFFNLLNKMLMLFLRINQKEISSSIKLSEHFLSILNDPFEKYFRISIIDQIYDKINNNLLLQEANEVKKVSYVKNKDPHKNFLAANKAKKISKKMIFLFCFILGCCSFIFYFLNFYNWSDNNDRIKKIIQLDIFFIDLYSYSATVICCNNLLIREKVIRNPLYENADHIYQKNAERIKFFFNILDKRLDYISNVTAFKLMQIGIEAKDKTKNPDFNEILNGNLCKFLVKKNEFEVDSFEFDFCEKILNNGFKNGIGAAENQFIQIIKLQRSNITKNYDLTQTDLLEEQRENIMEYLKDPMHMELLIGEFYLSQILLHLFDLISKYYADSLQIEIDAMNNFLAISFFFTIISGIVMILINQYYNNRKFRYISFIFYFIPYERINNDEQTVYLLKKFLKECIQYGC